MEYGRYHQPGWRADQARVLPDWHRGREAILDHIPNLEPERLESIEERFKESSEPMLLLSSIPGLGSAIAASAGLLHTPLLTFVVLVLISNLIRNGPVIAVFGQGIKSISDG